MTPELWIASAAVLVALSALPFTVRAANAARHQTAIQRQLREEAAQPYVWADVRPSDEHGQLLLLVVGNSGPTVATNVRVLVDGRLEGGGGNSRGAEARAVLAEGITALAPGRTMTWNLGLPWEFMKDDEPNSLDFTIEAEGPFGRVPTLRYTVDVDNIGSILAVPPGTLHGVAEAIKGLKKAITEESSRSVSATLLGVTRSLDKLNDTLGERQGGA